MGELVDEESFEYFRSHGPQAWRERAQDKINSHKVKA
jgi:hypothetical protein